MKKESKEPAVDESTVKTKPSPKSKKEESAVSLGDSIISAINDRFKTNTYKTAYHLTDPDVISDVTDYVSTSSMMLDIAISNKPDGGFPVGRISEITGLEQSGKSLLGAHALAETQKKNGIAVYIDTEAAVSKEFLTAIGVDITKMLYVPLETMEDIFETIESIIERVRRSEKNKLVTILVDSVMGASTKVEMAAEYDKDGYATAKSIIISKGMRKITNMIARQKICLIFTNQLRQNLKAVAFGDQFTTSGGKAIAFHSSVRLRLSQIGQLKGKVNGVEAVIGSKTKCIVKKNRLGPPLRSIEYDIYYDSGIDNFGGWLTYLKQYGLIKQTGAWYEVEYADLDTGEMIPQKFQSKDFANLLETVPGLKSYLREQLTDRYIMDYKINRDFGIDDVVVEDGDFSENS